MAFDVKVTTRPRTPESADVFLLFGQDDPVCVGTIVREGRRYWSARGLIYETKKGAALDMARSAIAFGRTQFPTDYRQTSLVYKS